MRLTLNETYQKAVEAHKADQFQDAERLYTAILQKAPKNPEVNFNMGVLAVSFSKVEEALPFFQIALDTNPSIEQYWLGYIDALIKLGQITNATAVFDQAKNQGFKSIEFDRVGLKLKNPSIVFSVKESPPQDQVNQLIHLVWQGQFKQVLDIIKILLSQYPNSYLLYNLQGAANAGLGQLNAAISSYRKSIEINPNYADTFNNLGVALKKNSDIEAAINSFEKALELKPDHTEAFSNMGNILKGLVFIKPNSNLMTIMISMLDQKTVFRPKQIARAAISLLKLEPSLKELLEKELSGKLRQQVHKTISTLSQLPLLLKLMSVCPISDLELEGVLASIRSALLSSVGDASFSPEVLHFQSILALQCFTNEYIYTQTNKETELIEELKYVIQRALLDGQQPSPQFILCLASYTALHEFEWCDLLTLNSNIKEVFLRQISEPKEESRLKANIPILQEITDSVSSKVREQYEVNPYPRWVDLEVPLHPKTMPQLANELNLRVSANLARDEPTLNILIAGCGTGQHSIGTASRFKDCKVLAIDLSLASLAYAKRKTEDLGIPNIEYMQADILDLGKLDTKFDIIESGGVLHHMDNPMAGWRVLTDCLKPGGHMKIALYRGLARQHIIKMREEISQSGIGSGDDAMRLFRSRVINSSKVYDKKILSSADFYSTSELRDLLFHVQEHQFTLPQIKGCLSELGLTFCGFEIERLVRDFKLTNIGPDDPYDLDKWDSYEQAHTDSFIGMYQFWCEKIT